MKERKQVKVYWDGLTWQRATTLLEYWSSTEFQHSETDLKNKEYSWDPQIIILQLFFVVSYYDNRLVLIVNKRIHTCTIVVSLSSIARIVKQLNSHVCNVSSFPTIPYLPKLRVSLIHMPTLTWIHQWLKFTDDAWLDWALQNKKNRWLLQSIVNHKIRWAQANIYYCSIINTCCY